jgi:anthranilate phosphoribosyltransferase
MTQERLAGLLKKKGIGPEGSKSLTTEELNELEHLLPSPHVSLTTVATMVTALLTLEPTPQEKEWLDKIKENPAHYLPEELLPFITGNTTDTFYKLILKVISRKDLTQEEADYGIQQLLDPQTPDYLKGAFLESQRLKRETFTENKAFFSGLWNKARRITTDLPVVLDIADSYDGFNRTYNFSLFTASLLASMEIPCIVHSVDQVAPKEGYTSHQLLKLAGKNPLISLQQGKHTLEDHSVGVCYVDQQVFFNDLYLLKKMRKEMVKRPFLATFEKLLQPIRSTQGNFIVSGYTHPHYKEELVKQLKEQGQCRKALIFKGLEGSTQLTLSRGSVSVLFDGKDIRESLVSPEDFSLPLLESKQDKNIRPEDVLAEGVAALEGKKNYAREALIYQATVIISKFNLIPSNNLTDLLKQKIDSGEALARWNKMNQ